MNTLAIDGDIDEIAKAKVYKFRNHMLPSQRPGDYEPFDKGDVLVISDFDYVGVLTDAVLDRKNGLLKFKTVEKFDKAVSLYNPDGETRTEIFFAFKKKGKNNCIATLVLHSFTTLQLK